VVGLAELGDKTQLLTFGFAARYSFWQVMSAVCAATAILMAVAVVFGALISRFIPQFYVSLAAGLFFLYFGLQTIFARAGEGATGGDGGRSPFVSVFAGFFLAELGDKTQLAALALTAKYGAPLAVWLGASLGMIAVNFLSVLAGRFARGLVEPRWLKYGGAAVFLYFGLTTLYVLFF